MSGDAFAMLLLGIAASGGFYCLGYRHGLRWARRLYMGQLARRDTP